MANWIDNDHWIISKRIEMKFQTWRWSAHELLLVLQRTKWMPRKAKMQERIKAKRFSERIILFSDIAFLFWTAKTLHCLARDQRFGRDHAAWENGQNLMYYFHEEMSGVFACMKPTTTELNGTLWWLELFTATCSQQSQRTRVREKEQTFWYRKCEFYFKDSASPPTEKSRNPEDFWGWRMQITAETSHARQNWTSKTQPDHGMVEMKCKFRHSHIKCCTEQCQSRVQ